MPSGGRKDTFQFHPHVTQGGPGLRQTQKRPLLQAKKKRLGKGRRGKPQGRKLISGCTQSAKAKKISDRGDKARGFENLIALCRNHSAEFGREEGRISRRTDLDTKTDSKRGNIENE